MTTPIVRLQVELNINEGQLDAFEDVAQQMIAVSRQEAGTLAYEFCLSADRTRCRIIEAYTSADAVKAHFSGAAVQEFVPKMLETSSISRFEVYGDPGPQVSAMVTGFGAEIFAAWHGFNR
jgi:quinol monooxygenase YgiN